MTKIDSNIESNINKIDNSIQKFESKNSLLKLANLKFNSEKIIKNSEGNDDCNKTNINNSKKQNL